MAGDMTPIRYGPDGRPSLILYSIDHQDDLASAENLAMKLILGHRVRDDGRITWWDGDATQRQQDGLALRDCQVAGVLPTTRDYVIDVTSLTEILRAIKTVTSGEEKRCYLYIEHDESPIFTWEGQADETADAADLARDPR